MQLPVGVLPARRLLLLPLLLLREGCEKLQISLETVVAGICVCVLPHIVRLTKASHQLAAQTP